MHQVIEELAAREQAQDLSGFLRRESHFQSAHKAQEQFMLESDSRANFDEVFANKDKPEKDGEIKKMNNLGPILMPIRPNVPRENENEGRGAFATTFNPDSFTEDDDEEEKVDSDLEDLFMDAIGEI